jgi:hypothetical protein
MTGGYPALNGGNVVPDVCAAGIAVGPEAEHVAAALRNGDVLI